MKTRRNHRKTTTGRRRRVVKQQRGQTRIHHRKKTVSSGRRHKFFKRGGEPQLDEIINKILEKIQISVKSSIGINISLTTDDVYEVPDKMVEPIEMTVNGKQIKFVIVQPKSSSIMQSVYIYVYKPETLKYELQKKIMLVVNNKAHHGSYFSDVATAIFNALKQYKP